MIDFVNIHAHSNLGSMKDGLSNIDDFFGKVKELGQKAVALTDHGYQAGYFDAYNASKKHGVKFIPGVEAYFVETYEMLENDKGKLVHDKRRHITLLASNHEGYKNLLKMCFAGFQNKVVVMGKVFPRIDWENLEKYSNGVICCSGCSGGVLNYWLRKGDYIKAKERAKKLFSIFKDRFFIEIHAHPLKIGDIDQIELNNSLIKIARELNLPITVGADTHYLTKKDAEYHDIMLAINEKRPVDDPDRFRYGIDEFYVKTGEQVYDFIKQHHGNKVAEETVSNTVRIADMCEEPDYMEQKGNHLPIFPVKDEPNYEKFLVWKKSKKLELLANDAAYMRYKCVGAFKERYGSLPKEERKLRWERVIKELKILEGNNFSSYMLIVADFIRWAKDQGILVGAGRGSCGGSMVAYLLGIHTVDPIEYGLLFERFQNAYKTSLPDIDTDFTSAGRDSVKEYVLHKYGTENCAQVSNINYYTPKNVIPDLVKSLRNVMPNLIPAGTHYVKVSDTIKDAISADAKTIEEALETSNGLRIIAQQEPRLIEYASQIVGLPKEYSTHAAAMVISNIPIVEFAPLRIDKNNAVAIQYEKDRCEAIGLVKIDFLAISTLDIIDQAFINIRKLYGEGPEQLEDIPMDDEETYKMLQDGQTSCVFQLGKSGIMPTLCKKLKPKNIIDIAAINALGRPSCKAERETYAYRRFGKEEIVYLHPSLKCLEETYGIPVFEEQLMNVAQNVAGWDLNKADGLRKMTKLKAKGKDLAEKLEIEFISDSMETHKMSYEKAKEIWDRLILPYSAYGFNKSHAIFYSILGYITAYLKRHYPAAFLAAYLKVKTAGNAIGRDEEIVIAKTECRRLKLNILPPDINKSTEGYEVVDKNTIVMGIKAIKGLGEKAVVELVAKQPYNSFEDFLYRTEGRIVNKSKLEALAKAGCFDNLNISRKWVCEEGKKARDKLNAYVRKNGNIGDYSIKIGQDDWTKREKLQNEMEVLDEMVSGNLEDLYPNFFIKSGVTPLSRIKRMPDRHEITTEVVIKAILRDFKIKNGRNAGRSMLKYQVEDLNGTQSEMTVWPDYYEFAKKYLVSGSPLRAKCQINEYNGTKSLVLQKVIKLVENA